MIEPGAQTTLESAAPSPRPQSRPPEDPWALTPLRDFIGQPTEMLLGTILPVGQSTVLFGAGEAGKSLLAAAIAVSVSTGVEVIPGWVPKDRLPVHVYDWETSGDDWRRRASMIARGVGVTLPDDLRYLRAPASVVDGREAIHRHTADLRPGLVIIDSTGFALPIEGDNEDPRLGILELHRVLRDAGTTSLILDHLAKNGGMYGSVYKTNAAREVFELTKRKANVRHLTHTKANNRARVAPQRLSFVFADESIRFETVVNESLETGDGDTKPSRRSSAMAMLAADPSVTRQQLVERIPGLEPGTASSYISKYKKSLVAVQP